MPRGISKAVFPGLLACCLVAIAPAVEAKPGVASPAITGPAIRAYKRDPLPIYDDAGERIREIRIADLPAIGSPATQVVRAKPGFVGIMLDGELAWLRLSMVDYVGDVKTIQCEATAMTFAKLEEDGLDQSLGLGCAK